MTETEVENLMTSLGVAFVNRSYGKATTKPITLECLTKAINQATQPLRIVTTGTGYFKPGLKGIIVSAREREVHGFATKTTISEFAIELDNGDRREFCQYGRDFRFDV